MARMIDQIRASKLPSNMMQFAARGALQVPPAENIEILVHLAVNNKVFGELARMLAMILASVVFPVPGGPQKMIDPASSRSIETRSGFPGPIKCS